LGDASTTLVTIPNQEPPMYQFRTRSLILSAIAVVLSACSSADKAAGPNAKTVSLSFSTHTAAGALVAGRQLSANLIAGSGSDTLIITKAQVVMSRVELVKADTAACSGDTTSATECEELKLDPSLVSLPVDSGVTTSLITAVPAGTYAAFEGKIRLVQASDAGGTAFLAANPTFNGVSVRVEGTFNGTPFVYTGTADAELELQFSPALVVDSTGMNITVNVDLSSWFRNGSGGLVDPATANAGGPNASLVEHNIHQSFEVFEDDNKDGHQDQ
jgi:hypothetical protein